MGTEIKINTFNNMVNFDKKERERERKREREREREREHSGYLLRNV